MKEKKIYTYILKSLPSLTLILTLTLTHVQPHLLISLNGTSLELFRNL